VPLKIQVFQDATWCRLVNSYRSPFLKCLTLKIRTLRSSETSVSICRSTQRNIQNTRH
jgi:hypothetical protein